VTDAAVRHPAALRDAGVGADREGTVRGLNGRDSVNTPDDFSVHDYVQGGMLIYNGGAT